MYRYILTATFLLLSFIPVQGQTNPGSKLTGQGPHTLRVSRAGGKRVRVVAGKYRTILNLSKDISGCLSLGDSMDRRRRLRRYPLALKVLDTIHRDSTWYVVILAGALPNCDVQAECGGDAGEPDANDMTLIWLKMNDRLHLESKQAELIVSCLARVELVNPDSWGALRALRGELTVDYETRKYYLKELVKSHLVYDRKTPERGFVIRTEKEKLR